MQLQYAYLLYQPYAIISMSLLLPLEHGIQRVVVRWVVVLAVIGNGLQLLRLLPSIQLRLQGPYGSAGGSAAVVDVVDPVLGLRDGVVPLGAAPLLHGGPGVA